MNNKQSEYIISLDRFEGPLDLLQQLIEKRKLQINTIALAKVTADYLSHVRKLSIMPVEEIARFMHIASILILIKSKSLLPILEYTSEEETDVQMLEGRIKIFDCIKKRAVPALSKWKKRAHIAEPQKQKKQPVFSPDNSCTQAILQKNALTVIKEVATFKSPPKKKVSKVVRIEDVIEKVMKTVTERMSISFKNIVAKADKQEKIVSFLAVLELMRKNLLMATQCKEFDDIVITKQTV